MSVETHMISTFKRYKPMLQIEHNLVLWNKILNIDKLFLIQFDWSRWRWLEILHAMEGIDLVETHYAVLYANT